MDHHPANPTFISSVSGQAQSVTPGLMATGSNANLNSVSQQPQAPQKRSTLEEAGGSQLQEGSKFRLQQVNGLTNLAGRGLDHHHSMHLH